MALIIPPGLSASRLSFMDGSQADTAKIDTLLPKVLTVEVRNTGCSQVILLYYLHLHSALGILQKKGCIFGKRISIFLLTTPKASKKD